MKRHVTFVMLTAVLAGCTQQRDIAGPADGHVGLAADARAAHASCPSGGTPSSGSRVNGGLQVDGTCILNGVTVNGRITVNSGGHLQLMSSTVNAGILVLPCGEIDVNATTNGNGTPTGTTATINGGIAINAGTNCPSPAFSDADIWTAHVNGGISLSGTYDIFGLPNICGNEIAGSITVDNLSVHPGGSVGNPDIGCPSNTIRGTISVSNSAFFEVEGNHVSGSVLLSGSVLELNGNTIGGSLQCSNGTVIVPGLNPLDPSGNTVHGANSC